MLKTYQGRHDLYLTEKEIGPGRLNDTLGYTVEKASIWQSQVLNWRL